MLWKIQNRFMKPLKRVARDLVKCEDMRIHAERACRYINGKSLEEFLTDDMTKDAVVRCVEVIGEAAKLVSEDTRSKSEKIPWTSIIGMRNMLAHDYGVINLDKVYEVVTVHLPHLMENIRPLLSALEAEAEWEDD